MHRLDLKRYTVFDDEVMKSLALEEAREVYPNLPDDSEAVGRYVETGLKRYRQSWDSIQEEGPILQDLAERAGITIATLDELSHDSVSGNEMAADVLLAHMNKEYLDATYTLFIPTLASAKTRRREIAGVLLDRFENGRYNRKVRSRIGFTVSEMLDHSHIQQLDRIVLNQDLESRNVLVVKFAKLAREKATPALINVIDEPGMLRMTLKALGFTRDAAAVACIKGYLDHSEADVRKYARESLKKLERFI